MIDDRFSAEAFEKCGPDSDAARKLSDDLADEIQKQVHTATTEYMEKIIRKLNSMGHNLKPYGEIRPGDISYRDDAGHGAAYTCKLRLAADTVVSAGYSHLTNPEDICGIGAELYEDEEVFETEAA